MYQQGQGYLVWYRRGPEMLEDMTGLSTQRGSSTIALLRNIVQVEHVMQTVPPVSNPQPLTAN